MKLKYVSKNWVMMLILNMILLPVGISLFRNMPLILIISILYQSFFSFYILLTYSKISVINDKMIFEAYLLRRCEIDIDLLLRVENGYRWNYQFIFKDDRVITVIGDRDLEKYLLEVSKYLDNKNPGRKKIAMNNSYYNISEL